MRFSQEENGPFLACGESARIPPLIELPWLLSAAEHSLDNAFSVSEYFGISAVEAREIAAVVGRTVKMWRKEAAKFGLKSKEIDRMSSAFEHPDLGAALSRK